MPVENSKDPQSVKSTDIRPDPDPTAMTTQQTRRETDFVRELTDARFLGSEQLYNKVVEWLEKYIVQKLDTSDRVGEEKFKSIALQFKERDVRTEQAAGAVKIAVDAALQAQKEAVGEQNKAFATATSKSETATMKQIDQQGELIKTTAKATDDKIADLKDRITSMEGKTVGHVEQRTGSQGTVALVIAVVGLAVMMIVGFAGLILRGR